MKMDRESALDYLKDVVENKRRHQDYVRVTELAEKYYALVTGDGLDEMLQRIVTRETDEMFEQRKKITKHIIPSIISPAKLPYLKACRKQPIVKSIDYETKDNVDTKVNELNDYIKKYWGDKSLEEFLEWAFVDYMFIDPNAFIVTDFAPFDAEKEKAKPYPTVISSEQAIDYEIVNEQLQYLTINLKITYKEGDMEKEGDQFILMQGDLQFELIQVAKDMQSDNEIVEINANYYEFIEYTPFLEEIPAHRIGYIKDYQTQGRTCLSLIDCAVPILEKTLKINSEMDLSCAMVAFPQRFAYVQACNYESCNRGYLSDGSVCPECKGTGTRKHHGSTMDVVELPMPLSKDDMIPLSDLLFYNNPPIDLLKFQDEYCDKLKTVVFKTMFNSEIFTRNDTVQTATEKTIEVDNMNDTLFPFLRKYSQLWREIVKDIAEMTELSKGIVLDHKFPFDLKFKSLSDLMNDLKIAKDSGASSGTIAAIEDDINEILYADRPEALKEIRIKNFFNPFRGFTAERLAMVINTGMTSKFNEVLYLNIENIFQELEQESPIWVYDLSYEKIGGLIKVKVDELITKLNEESIQAYSFSQPTQNEV